MSVHTYKKEGEQINYTCGSSEGVNEWVVSCYVTQRCVLQNIE